MNPAYYDKMSSILEDLIEQAKQEAIEYQEYLDRLVELAKLVVEPETGEKRPNAIDSSGKAAIYDNVGKDLNLTLAVHAAINGSRHDGWRTNKMKKRKIMRAIESILPTNLLDERPDLLEVLVDIAGGHSEY